jgi:signal peptidase I
MVHFFKKILGGLYLLAVIVLVLVGCFVFWGSRNGWGFAAILSGSMEPTFNVGGMVVVKPVDTRTLKIGDAISFRLPGFNVPICHRIIDIRYRYDQKYFMTKGDANEEADQNLVPLSDVNGKVIYHIPYVGRLAEVKNLTTFQIFLPGKQLSAGTLIVLVTGVLFIGLILKDHMEDLMWPARRRRRDILKKQNIRLMKRRQAFKIR